MVRSIGPEHETGDAGAPMTPPVVSPVVRTGNPAGQARLVQATVSLDEPVAKPIIIENGPALLMALQDKPDWTVLLEHYSQERYFKLPEGTQIVGEDLPKNGVVIATIGEAGIDTVTQEEMAFDEAVGQFEILNEVATPDERLELVGGLNYGDLGRLRALADAMQPAAIPDAKS